MMMGLSLSTDSVTNLVGSQKTNQLNAWTRLLEEICLPQTGLAADANVTHCEPPGATSALNPCLEARSNTMNPYEHR